MSEFFSDNTLTGIQSNFSCNGAENKLTDCRLTSRGTCSLSDGDVGIVCAPLSTVMGVMCEDGDVRVVGGETVLEGRVEVCGNRAWGTVCGRGFTEDEAHTVCTQLGLPFNGQRVFICYHRTTVFSSNCVFVIAVYSRHYYITLNV